MVTMMVALRLLAFICFILAAVGVTSRVNLVALGLAIWMLSLLVLS